MQFQIKKKVVFVLEEKLHLFFNTLEDSGAFPVECDVSKLEMGQEDHI